jgi:hypothetical protein
MHSPLFCSSFSLFSPRNIVANESKVRVTYTSALSAGILRFFAWPQYWGQQLLLKSGLFISYDVEPFLPSTWLAPGRTSEAAYPPETSRSGAFLPLNLYFSWLDEGSDQVFHDAIKASAENIRAIAIAEGQQSIVDAPVYPNYAVYDTPLERMYLKNVDRLKALKRRVDPNNIMGLAGGFKF